MKDAMIDPSKDGMKPLSDVSEAWYRAERGIYGLSSSVYRSEFFPTKKKYDRIEKVIISSEII